MGIEQCFGKGGHVCVYIHVSTLIAHRDRTVVLSDRISVTCSALWSTLGILATSPGRKCTPLALQRCSRSSLSLLLQTLQTPHMQCSGN